MQEPRTFATRAGPAPTGARFFIGRMDLQSVTPQLIFPSGGDCSYPGLVWHDGLLWVSYYSSHEGKSSIYLAKVKLQRGAASDHSAR